MSLDERYIRQVIREYERRHKVAVSCFIIGILCLLAAYPAYFHLSASVNIDLFVGHLNEGMVLSDALIDSVRDSHNAALSTGLSIGVTVSMLILPSILLIGRGIRLLFNSKKDEIIKQLYEQS